VGNRSQVHICLHTAVVVFTLNEIKCHQNTALLCVVHHILKLFQPPPLSLGGVIWINIWYTIM